MFLHILKLTVGIDEISSLRAIQHAKLKHDGLLFHYTRNYPRRAEEIISGGSIYWIIRGYIQVRQRIISIEKISDRNGKRCAILLDQNLIPTELQPRKPHRGWRYLNHNDVPLDLLDGDKTNTKLPVGLISELRDLGLW